MMVPEVITRRKLTLAEYEALPDDQDYEIIDGDLYMSPRARPGHQRVAGALIYAITNHTLASSLGVVVPDADLVVDDQNTYVSPDIMYFASNRYGAIDPNDWIRIMPDLVIEILSPGTERYDLRTKRALYQRLGIPHYWIADAREHTLAENVLQPNGQYHEHKHGPDGSFRPALFPDLELDLVQVFQ